VPVNVMDVLVLDDGSVFICGDWAKVDDQAKPGLVKLKPTGELDTAFPFALPDDMFGGNRLAALPGGLVFHNAFGTVGATTRGWIILNAAGQEVTNYLTGFPGFQFGHQINTLVVAPDGRRYLGGFSRFGWLRESSSATSRASMPRARLTRTTRRRSASSTR
jgi:hypothetical protein